MKEAGSMGRQKVRGSSIMLMATYMRDSGMEIKLMERAHILIRMGLNTMESGRTTSSMGRVMRSGMRGVSMWGSMSWGRRKDMESTHGLMALFMRETG